MLRYRLTNPAEADIIDVLAWSETLFGPRSRLRYERLIVTGLSRAGRFVLVQEGGERDRVREPPRFRRCFAGPPGVPGSHIHDSIALQRAHHVYKMRQTYTWIGSAAMRTNIDIDDALLSRAMTVTGLSTKRATVEEGLRLLVRVRGQLEALTDLEGLGWEGDLDAMRDGRPAAGS